MTFSLLIVWQTEFAVPCPRGAPMLGPPPIGAPPSAGRAYVRAATNRCTQGCHICARKPKTLRACMYSCCTTPSNKSNLQLLQDRHNLQKTLMVTEYFFVSTLAGMVVRILQSREGQNHHAATRAGTYCWRGVSS